MANKAIELFYSYAPEDHELLARLDAHLAPLRRSGMISTWSNHDVPAGGLPAQEIQTHLRSAQIILLLISPAFLNSEDCYSTEMQEALARPKTGSVHIIPILLRPVDWEHAPFGHLRALPRDGIAVTIQPDRDAAFAEIAKEIRTIVEQLQQTFPTTPSTDEIKSKKRDKEKQQQGEPRVTIPTGLDSAKLKKPIDRYIKAIEEARELANYELGVRAPFQNLLTEVAPLVGWRFYPEESLRERNIRPDGVLRDGNGLRRGFWEAKGPKGNLEQEIEKKIKDGYPLTNTIFENALNAVLYQNKKRLPGEYDLSNRHHVADLLHTFFEYTEPHIEKFQSAVTEFKERLPELANDLLKTIGKGHQEVQAFKAAFADFATLCRRALDPHLSEQAIDEMIVQHLLTERLFRTVFNNPNFVRRNIIASEIQKVVDALTSDLFEPQAFFESLDRYYVAIEQTAKGIGTWQERQEFLNTVYEGFFQGYSIQQADTHGIVYTPQEIVDFMCASVDEVLKREFGKSLSDKDVKILDPCTGTGNFIVNLIRNHIPYGSKLAYKYNNDLFCNEITLLPYYIASLNIEHEYYEKMKRYEPFKGLCFADTLELAEGQQLFLFVEENTERVKRQKEAQIMVVLGNPPYNAKQMNENDNNKNRKYPIVDERINKTYVKSSQATNKNQLYDAYVKFFRWATDRLGDRDGIICFVSNNSFLDKMAFDGMRKHLLQDFTHIYHLDLHGDVRKNPKLSGTTHNVFGIQVGVGITIAIRKSAMPEKKISYYRVPEYWKRTEKLAFLAQKASIQHIEWVELHPDKRSTWITEGFNPEFETYLPLGSKEARAAHRSTVTEPSGTTLFRTYSMGPRTARDDWAYDFHQDALTKKVHDLAEAYNAEVDRWRRRGSDVVAVDDFVKYKDKEIKWSEGLKLQLQRGIYAQFVPEKIRRSLYRPFCQKWLFFDRILIERVYQFPSILPDAKSEQENVVIIVGGYGRKHFAVLASNHIPDANFYVDPAQCFPYYTYAEDGTNRRENITDWALLQFQNKYGPDVSKWDIFHYIYALLHHPQYRQRYAENLKRDLPHIPLVRSAEAFRTCVNIGEQLMRMHLNYEAEDEYELTEHNDGSLPYNQCYRVEKMRLTSENTAIIINKAVTFTGIPQECFAYHLGNRSALEWVIDQYQVTTEKRSGMVSNPNRLDDPEYIVRLVKQVVMVSVKTVRLMEELERVVVVDDWLENR